ncbi:MAG: aspartate dehydrogenase [Eubacteriales bacterium]|nr:aspartate dehydrogenase [Eubacteriales bacterium]
MRLFGRKSKVNIPDMPYDPSTQEPVLSCSICTGEQVAGFRDKRTGDFKEVMLIRTPEELDAFKRKYGVVGEIERIY